MKWGKKSEFDYGIDLLHELIRLNVDFCEIFINDNVATILNTSKAMKSGPTEKWNV